MTGIDLDRMRIRWQQQSARVDSKLNLDIDAVRATLVARSTSAFRRHTRWLMAALCGDAVALILLAAFMLRHTHDWVYLVVAASLALVMLAETITDLHEWRTIRALDSSAPLIEVQARFDDLRSRRLRMTGWILLLSIMLWLPLLAVAFKGLFGFDLLRRLHWSVAVVNVAAGLLFIPFASTIAQWLSRRFAGSPAFQRMLDEVAGKSFDVARQSVQQRTSFEAGVAEGADDATLAAHLQAPIWPDAAQLLLRALRQRLMLGIFVYASLLAATGLFIAGHGALPQVIVPGVLLNILWGALMATGIEQRVRLSRLATSPTLAAARTGLEQLATWRAAVVRHVICVMPLLSLALAQVLATVLVGIDLWSLAGPATTAIITGITLVLGAALYRRMRRAPATFAPHLVDALCFGAIGKTRALIAGLDKVPV
jgi:nitrate reductase NapE component